MSVWVADWTADTQHLTCEQDGAYWRLIRALWRAHGVLKNDERHLATIVGLSVKKWRAISADVLAFFEVDESSIQHEKLTITLLSVVSKSDSRASNGAKGGRAKALKRLNPGLANATDLPPDLPQQTPSISNIRCQIDDDDARESDDWPAGEAKDWGALACTEADSKRLDPDKVTGLGRFNIWRRDGASWVHDVLPSILAVTAKAKQPISNWSYFEGAICASIAENRRALTIPEHDDVQRPDTRRAESGHAGRKRGALEALDALERGDGGGPAAERPRLGG
jgi:hypothetical protein